MASWGLLMVVLSPLLVGPAIGQDCPSSSISLSNAVKMMKTDILLFGQDVTTQVDCRGDTGTCNYRQITFNVHCIMANLVNAPISPTITIGNRPPAACDGTYFAHDETGEMLVVMVKYDSATGLFDWDEVVPGEPAKFIYTESLQTTIEDDTCAVAEWTVPVGAVGGATCPPEPTNSCPGLVFGDLNLQYQTEGVGYIGSICCTAVLVSPSYGWLSGSNQKASTSELMNRPNMVSFMENMVLDAQYTVVAYAVKSDLSRVSANWVVVNVPYEDTFMTSSSDAIDVISYVPPTPYQRNGTPWIYRLYLQNGNIPSVNANTYLYDNCQEECFKLNKFVSDFGLTPTMMDVTVNVTMDTFSLWQLYHNQDMMHSEVCTMWNSDIVVQGSFALCPAQDFDSASNAPALSILLLLVSLICHLLATPSH